MSYFDETIKAIVELKKGNYRNLETIIRFLEKDEYRFGSGYLKEQVWKTLAKVNLTERQKERIFNIAISYLNKRMQREFWYMCRFVYRISNDNFKRNVENLAKSENKGVNIRANLLLAYLINPNIGEEKRHEFHNECLSKKYRFRW